VPQRKNVDGRYLIAEPSGFPGVGIPLLSDEEWRARGIEPGRLPPRETWAQAQRDAADKLEEILIPHVFQEALHVILGEIEREPADSKISEAEIEKVAARRGVALIDTGKWKQRDTWVHFPPSWVRQVLEMFERGDVSLLNPRPIKRRRRGRGKA
jgi:hypothetical protein